MERLRRVVVDGKKQLCLCIFGASRHEKRYLRPDLSARYELAKDLHDGIEILRLYP